jgi:transposase
LETNTKCSTFTGSLQQLAEWLMQCGIKTVAMESTGVYWVPIYELLEQQGIVPYLVNGRHVKMPLANPCSAGCC